MPGLYAERSRRPRFDTCLFALAVSAAALCVAGSQAAQTNGAVPDFSGQWVRTGRYPESFDASPGGPGPIMIDPAHPHRRNPEGGQSHDGWVADLTNPILKPEIREKMKAVVAAEIAGSPHLKLIDMCYPAGVPMILNQRDPLQMLQTPDEIVFFYTRDSLSRHVFLNRPHSKNPPHTWFGESVGHFEGDTLVVDTIGQNSKTYTDRFFTPHSDKIHVVERYKISADRKTMRALIRVDDPETFTTPWTAQAVYGADATPLEEIVCAENNRGFDSKPISEHNDHGFESYPSSPPMAVKADF